MLCFTPTILIVRSGSRLASPLKDRSRRSSGPLAKVESTVARGEWTSREWRVGEFQGATRRYTGSTRPVEWPHGESTRRGAAVHSVRRVARGGGRGSTRPGESTAASTCAAATFSADPSYPLQIDEFDALGSDSV